MVEWADQEDIMAPCVIPIEREKHTGGKMTREHQKHRPVPGKSGSGSQPLEELPGSELWD